MAVAIDVPRVIHIVKVLTFKRQLPYYGVLLSVNQNYLLFLGETYGGG